MKEYNKVLNYWFPNNEYNKFWFSADIETDDFIIITPPFNIE